MAGNCIKITKPALGSIEWGAGGGHGGQANFAGSEGNLLDLPLSLH